MSYRTRRDHTFLDIIRFDRCLLRFIFDFDSHAEVSDQVLDDRVRRRAERKGRKNKSGYLPYFHRHVEDHLCLLPTCFQVRLSRCFTYDYIENLQTPSSQKVNLLHSKQQEQQDEQQKEEESNKQKLTSDNIPKTPTRLILIHLKRRRSIPH